LRWRRGDGFVVLASGGSLCDGISAALELPDNIITSPQTSGSCAVSPVDLTTFIHYLRPRSNHGADIVADQSDLDE
jgi:hypothetical protein